MYPLLLLLFSLVLGGSGASNRTSTAYWLPSPKSQPASIVFPTPASSSSHAYSSSSSVPLSILRSIGESADFGRVIREFVSNARIHSNASSGEQFLVNKEGRAILDTRGNKIFITKPKANKPIDGTTLRTRVVSIGLPGSSNTSSSSSPPNTNLSGRMGSPRIPGQVVTVLPEAKSSLWSVAICRPEEKTVAVELPFHKLNPHVIHHPRCIRVDRCGGCCGSEILTCEPKEVERLEVPVDQYEYVDSLKGLNYVGREYVGVDRHVSCECGCRIKEHNCSSLQEYRKEECACVCKNIQEQLVCQSQSQIKIWDPQACTCACKEIRECSSGFSFDLNTCACAPTARSGRERRKRQHRQTQRNLNS